MEVTTSLESLPGRNSWKHHANRNSEFFPCIIGFNTFLKYCKFKTRAVNICQGCCTCLVCMRPDPWVVSSYCSTTDGREYTDRQKEIFYKYFNEEKHLPSSIKLDVILLLCHPRILFVGTKKKILLIIYPFSKCRIDWICFIKMNYFSYWNWNTQKTHL